MRGDADVVLSTIQIASTLKKNVWHYESALPAYTSLHNLSVAVLALVVYVKQRTGCCSVLCACHQELLGDRPTWQHQIL